MLIQTVCQQNSLPRLLALDQKQCRVTTYEQCIDMYQRDPNEFLRSYVTVDEPWIHHYTPKTNPQSKMGIGPNVHALQNAKLRFIGIRMA